MDTSIKSTGTGLSWTDSQGKRHDYGMEGILTLAMSLAELRASKLVRRHPCDALDKPFTLKLYGKAVLRDSKIQIVGRPETSSCELNVMFEELSEEDIVRLAAAPRDKQVSLSYTAADIEANSAGNWLATILLPPIQFRELNQAYESQSLSRVSLGLHLEGLYVREWEGAPPSPVEWFAEPDGELAKPVIGEMHSLELETKALRLAAP